MVQQLTEAPSARLLKHVIRCYQRLTDNVKAREAMRASLPEPFRDGSFAAALKTDPASKKCLQTLLQALDLPSGGQ